MSQMASTGMKHPCKQALLLGVLYDSTYLLPPVEFLQSLADCRILYQYPTRIETVFLAATGRDVDGPLVQVAQLLCVRGAVQRHVCE